MELYGNQHRVTIATMEKSYLALLDVLARGEEIVFTITEDSFLVNNEPQDTRLGVTGELVAKLRSFGVSGLTFTKDVPADDYVKLFTVLMRSAEENAQVGHFGQVLEAEGVTSIQSKKVTFVEVSEDEAVVNKDELEGMGAAEKAARNDQIVGFLSGTGDGGEGGGLGGSGASLKDLSDNTHDFGEMIVMAAANAPGDESKTAEEETPVDFVHKVIHCLRRAFDALQDDPGFKTQKGKKELSRTLATLETELVAQLRATGVGFSEEDLSGISEAVEDMTDEVKIDSLASEYMKKVKAVDSSETRLMRYIKRKSDDLDDGVLREKLMSGGLTAGGWSQLLVDSGVVEGAMSEDDINDQFQGDGVARLGGMLGKLDEEFRAACGSDEEGSEEKMRKLIATVEKEVSGLVDRTESKIQALAEEFVDDGSGTGKKTAGGLSKKKMVEMLAEVVQELCQPLVVINTSISMMTAEHLGPVNEHQKSMMDLAMESCERMSYLIDEIGKVSGTPDGLNPDLEGVGLQASTGGGIVDD